MSVPLPRICPMGANARRRHGDVGRAASPAVTAAAFARLVRSACSACGSRSVNWSTLGSVPERAPEDVRSYAAQMRPVLGASAEFWWCGECAEAGAFEQELHHT